MINLLQTILGLLTGVPQPIAALAFVGFAACMIGAGMALDTVVRLIGRSILRARARRRTARELRDLEMGTCDGLTAVQIMRVVDESWVLGSDRT